MPKRQCGVQMYNEVVYEASTGLEVGIQEEASTKRKSNRYAYRFAKRSFDIVFSLVVIIVLFIPCLILCFAIMIDSQGSPIFCQKRVGKNGKMISVYKFRTMHSDAHENPSRYLTSDQLFLWKTEFKIDNDPRITRIGGFLRKTSLDELPQFLSVFLGTMTTVGPRPVTEEELQYFAENKERFLEVKPGITGYWQVSSRNNSKYADGSRQKIEMHYVNNASLAFDMKIILSTFSTIAQKTGK